MFLCFIIKVFDYLIFLIGNNLRTGLFRFSHDLIDFFFANQTKTNLSQLPASQRMSQQSCTVTRMWWAWAGNRPRTQTTTPPGPSAPTDTGPPATPRQALAPSMACTAESSTKWLSLPPQSTVTWLQAPTTGWHPVRAEQFSDYHQANWHSLNWLSSFPKAKKCWL